MPLGIEMWEMFDFGHEVNIKELRETMNRLLKETDEDNLRLAVKIRRLMGRQAVPKFKKYIFFNSERREKHK